MLPLVNQSMYVSHGTDWKDLSSVNGDWSVVLLSVVLFFKT